MGLEIKDGEVICDRCDGEGKIETIKPDDYIAVYYIQCPKCRGIGKLDWIENIVGKQTQLRFHPFQYIEWSVDFKPMPKISSKEILEVQPMVNNHERKKL